MQVKFYFLAISLFSSLISFGQITLDSSDMPSAGEVVPVSVTAVLPEGVDPAATGIGLIWDYSELEPGLNDIDTFFTVAQTPLLFQFFFNNDLFYPSYAADHARKEMDVNLGLVNISDAYSYFKSDAEGYRNVGFGANINGLPSSVRNEPIDWLYEFPLEYGDSFSSSSASELEIPALGYYHHEQVRDVVVEGWGTLILPDGSYDVLKVKMTVDAQDSIYVAQFSNGFSIDQPVEVIYQWLAAGEGTPLLEISQQAGFGYTVRYRFEDALSLDDLSDVGVSVYPNPAFDFLHICTAGLNLREYTVYDSMGRIIVHKSQLSALEGYDVPVYSLKRGTYSILMDIGGQSYFSSFIKG